MLLTAHIAGAVSSFVFGGAAILKKSAFFRNLMRAGVVFEIFTGTVLSIATQTGFLNYCAKMGLYLAAWLMFEGLYVIRTSQQVNRALQSEE